MFRMEGGLGTHACVCQRAWYLLACGSVGGIEKGRSRIADVKDDNL